VHHIEFWTSGGSTDLDNLMLACGQHHKSVHHDGWKVARGPDGRISVTLPDGKILSPTADERSSPTTLEYQAQAA
jgi:hypothetical protein